MACGEYGPGRLPEPEAIFAAIARALDPGVKPLHGKHVIVTAGPTHEPIDPVRVIANRSSGKQGFAIAEALAAQGARVTLVAGPVSLATPPGVDRIDVETAREMAAAVDHALPADAAILVAAVADWRVEAAPSKLKKAAGPASARLGSEPRHPRRPRLQPAPPAACWSASPPRPAMSSQKRRPSAPARAATGSSPTTFRAT